MEGFSLSDSNETKSKLSRGMGIGKATEPAAAANVQEGGQIQTQTATGGQGAQKTHYIWPANPETATAI